MGRTDSGDYEDYSQYPDFNELSEYIGDDTVMLIFELTKVFNVVCAQNPRLKSVFNCYVDTDLQKHRMPIIYCDLVFQGPDYTAALVNDISWTPLML